MSCGILQKVKWFWDFFQIRSPSNTFKRLRNINLVRNPRVLVVMKTSTFQFNRITWKIFLLWRFWCQNSAKIFHRKHLLFSGKLNSKYFVIWSFTCVKRKCWFGNSVTIAHWSYSFTHFSFCLHLSWGTHWLSSDQCRSWMRSIMGNLMWVKTWATVENESMRHQN